jgi:hypothetical protein
MVACVLQRLRFLQFVTAGRREHGPLRQFPKGFSAANGELRGIEDGRDQRGPRMQLTEGFSVPWHPSDERRASRSISSGRDAVERRSYRAGRPNHGRPAADRA